MLQKIFQIKKIKIGPTEIEFFGNIQTYNNSEKETSLKVDITNLAKRDLRASKLNKKKLLDEITHLMQRHPLLLKGSFDSLPINVFNHIILISYILDSHLTVERILPKANETPLYIAWAEVLSLYRIIASQPYRTMDVSLLAKSSDSKRIIRLLNQILFILQKYFVLYSRCFPHVVVTLNQISFNGIMQEIELELANGEIGNAVAKIEILLSNVHKVIITCAPTESLGKIIRGMSESELQSIPIEQKNSILIAEDEPGLREIFKDILEKEGYNVDVAIDGSEAVNFILRKKYSIIISDIVMPKLAGTTVISIAKFLNSTDTTILISGFFGIKRLIKDIHVVDITFPKPFKTSEFLETVNRLLDEKLNHLPEKDFHNE